MSSGDRLYVWFLFTLIFLHNLLCQEVLENKLDTIIEAQQAQCQKEANQ